MIFRFLLSVKRAVIVFFRSLMYLVASVKVSN